MAPATYNAGCACSRAAEPTPMTAPPMPASSSVRLRTTSGHREHGQRDRGLRAATPNRRLERAVLEARPLARALYRGPGAPAGGTGDGELERGVREANAHLDAGGVLERVEQLLDDAVGGELDRGREHPGVPLDGQPGLAALGPHQQRLQVRQRRLRIDRGLGGIVAEHADEGPHLLEGAATLALDLGERGRRAGGVTRTGPFVGQPRELSQTAL